MRKCAEAHEIRSRYFMICELIWNKTRINFQSQEETSTCFDSFPRVCYFSLKFEQGYASNNQEEIARQAKTI